MIPWNEGNLIGVVGKIANEDFGARYCPALSRIGRPLIVRWHDLIHLCETDPSLTTKAPVITNIARQAALSDVKATFATLTAPCSRRHILTWIAICRSLW